MNPTAPDNRSMHDTPLTFLDFLKLACAWLGYMFSHAFDLEVLQRLSFGLAAVYTGLQVYVFCRDKLRRPSREVDRT